MKAKKTALLAALACIFLTITAGTIAYLTDTSGTVKNTFTVGQVKIDLTETASDYKDDESYYYQMVPGAAKDKNPVVTVKKGSLASWLFIEVTESDYATLSDYIGYKIRTEGEKKWTPGDGVKIPENVYYLKAGPAEEEDYTYPILGGGTYTSEKYPGLGTFTWKDDQVLVKPEVTRKMLEALKPYGNIPQPTLTFTAYAVQLAGFEEDAAGAWREAKKAAK